VDPGGFSIYPGHYAALQKLWREKSLSVRVAFSLFAQNVGAEFEEYKALTPFLPMGFGDDMLRFNGLGERITGAMYNNNAPDAAARDKFREIVRWAAKQGLTVTIHWQEDKSVHQLLDLYDEVNKETPIAPLRCNRPVRAAG
jgi:predicted amidohydrolase YtcJ